MSSYRRYRDRLAETSGTSSITSSATSLSSSSSSHSSTNSVPSQSSETTIRRTTAQSTNFSRATPLRSTWATGRPALPPKPPKNVAGLDKYDVSSTVPEESKPTEFPIGSREFIGFATLPDQVHRKSVKKGFEFTLLVVGESGLGKSTLINSLFLTDFYKQRAVLNAEERIRQTVGIERATQDIEEGGVRLRLTVVDTPGFGDAIDNTESIEPILTYVDDQFEQYFRDESGLNRKNIVDNRIHCCLYVISPFGHGLRPMDIEFMRRMHEKVNIIPVIGKSDCLTPKEIKKLKQRILDEIDEHDIKIYRFESDSDDEDDVRRENEDLQASLPFAIIGSNTVVEIGGKKVRGRLYPWGIAEVENPEHCDFVKLRNLLIRTHMQDLKEVTQDVHYENFRSQKIQDGGGTDTRTKQPSSSEDKDEKLKEKENELKKMQEMILVMQRQMAMQQPNGSSGDYNDKMATVDAIDM